MLEIVIAVLGTLAGGYVVDRVRYGRQIMSGLAIAAQTKAWAKIPSTARELAEHAVLAANQREVEAAMRKYNAQAATRSGELAAAIKRGEENAEHVTTEIVKPTGEEAFSKWPPTKG